MIADGCIQVCILILKLAEANLGTHMIAPMAPAALSLPVKMMAYTFFAQEIAPPGDGLAAPTSTLARLMNWHQRGIWQEVRPYDNRLFGFVLMALLAYTQLSTSHWMLLSNLLQPIISEVLFVVACM